MKKILLTFIAIVGLLCLEKNVFAATSEYKSDDGTYSNESNYNELESKYNTGSKTTISSSQTIVTIYGKSDCNSSSCTYTYSGNSTKPENTLAKSVICPNGETNVKYQFAGSGNENYKEDNKANLDGTAYWSEDYYITCTSETSGNDVISTIPSNNTGGTPNGNTGGTPSGGNYGSSSTTDNPEQGVETYYIVLGIVALISYTMMYLVKKYNLFKKI